MKFTTSSGHKRSTSQAPRSNGNACRAHRGSGTSIPQVAEASRDLQKGKVRIRVHIPQRPAFNAHAQSSRPVQVRRSWPARTDGTRQCRAGIDRTARALSNLALGGGNQRPHSAAFVSSRQLHHGLSERKVQDMLTGIRLTLKKSGCGVLNDDYGRR